MVTNTGNTKLTSTTIIDSLTDGLGNARSLNTTVTYVSTVATVTTQVAKQNLFYYSNRVDDVDYQWNENGGNQGSVESEWGWPVGIPYYFNTDSGSSYSNVDWVFQTNGFGNTRSPDSYGNTDNRSHRYSRVDNDARTTDYIYQDVTLEANTQYTVSVYAAAYSTSYVNSMNNYDRLRFAYRTPSGSLTWGPYNNITCLLYTSDAADE